MNFINKRSSNKNMTLLTSNTTNVFFNIQGSLERSCRTLDGSYTYKTTNNFHKGTETTKKLQFTIGIFVLRFRSLSLYESCLGIWKSVRTPLSFVGPF